ncbi:MAG: aminodeoxychorismate lyase [Acidiferrobacterales bacterium]
MTVGHKHYVNGEPVDRVTVLDRGLRYGDGCFETMAVRGGGILLWNRHYQRLMQGCDRLHIEPDFDRVQLERELATLIGDTDQAIVRLTVTRGSAGKGYAYPERQQPTRILSLLPGHNHPPKYWQEGVSIRICNTRLGRNPALAGIKHLNRLEQVLARAEWNDEFAEGLMLDDQGQVIEGTITNVFIVEQKKVYTPLLDSCGVAGVMRAELLERMKHLGIVVREEAIDRDRLLAADECFLTNAVIGIWPVKAIENKPLEVGNVTRRLMKELGEFSDQ